MRATRVKFPVAVQCLCLLHFCSQAIFVMQQRKLISLQVVCVYNPVRFLILYTHTHTANKSPSNEKEDMRKKLPRIAHWLRKDATHKMMAFCLTSPTERDRHTERNIRCTHKLRIIHLRNSADETFNDNYY